MKTYFFIYRLTNSIRFEVVTGTREEAFLEAEAKWNKVLKETEKHGVYLPRFASNFECITR